MALIFLRPKYGLKLGNPHPRETQSASYQAQALAEEESIVDMGNALRSS
jgi:hypothetical protein